MAMGKPNAPLAEYTLMLACAGSALLAVCLPPAGQTLLALGWVLVYGLLAMGVGRLERRRATVSAP
jgi:hypothetical protein